MKCTSGPHLPLRVLSSRTFRTQRKGQTRKPCPRVGRSLHRGVREAIMDSLIDWRRAGQRPDFTLDMQEWEHALREWRAANWPRCRCECDDLFDMCLNCITHQTTI